MARNPEFEQDVDQRGTLMDSSLLIHGILKHQVPAGQLNIHADRGRVMTSKPVAFLMADLGRYQDPQPALRFRHNPYSESQFRTMKYRP